MKYIHRNTDKELIKWKSDPLRKPLLLRGARQVGKSSLVKHFSSHFESYIEVNFEMQLNITTIFDKDLNPIRICEELSVVYDTKIIPGQTLLFFDEIQLCPNAISSLRFFYEKLPQLHVIAAGSLLEFALEQLHSFGVGRIRSLFLYPFSFGEFLFAMENSLLLQAIDKATPQNPLNDVIHQKALDVYKRFLIIGGMPKVVSTYIETNDLMQCQQMIDDILISYADDFAKYKKRMPALVIQSVLKMVSEQTGQKLMFSKRLPELNNLQIKEALRLLTMAGIIYPVTHSAANSIPLGGQLNSKIRKYIIFDTGIFQRMQKLNISDILLHNTSSLKNIGTISEQHVGLEFIKNSSCYEKMELYYWHRESRNSQAEVDYIIQQQQQIIPVEVKSGSSGSMQSLYLFMKEKQSSKGIRISMEHFTSYNNIDVYPLYAVKNCL